MGEIETRIRGLVPTLTPAEQRVAEQVLADPLGTHRGTIGQLAERSRTSLTTVTRFCRALGMAGYQELRFALATEAGEASSRDWTLGAAADIGPDDPMQSVLANLVATDVRALQETASQLDLAVAEQLVDAITTARRVDLYAVSGSAAVTNDLQRRLHQLGITCHLWIDVHDALASATLLGPEDVAIGISHSGETIEVIEPLTAARDAGAVTAAVTNFPRSAITSVAGLLLTTSAREATYRSGSLSGRHTQLLVIDCLVTGVAQRTSPASDAAVARTAAAVRPHRVGRRTPTQEG
ncbi:transcriptional regulator, RpiR family [Kribbella flavida DSM 17836]|uniref:Transcriptional regulator, RpiR family n=1 Tax=Kribbella flavida (strain DSM 17836 / JCM 10339 / NBRC 14399) TaxID=479435 RepID=D2PUN7_KRIFD|nr:MurR/RpiR family transcriptional regulator [Kribbella flavida]ADB29555.1 transcriptional regulator, RpiR family [Kribbella flavida DSM 17836]